MNVNWWGPLVARCVVCSRRYWSELCIDACQTSDLLRLPSLATYKGRTSDEVPMLRCEKCNVDVASQVCVSACTYTRAQRVMPCHAIKNVGPR